MDNDESSKKQPTVKGQDDLPKEGDAQVPLHFGKVRKLTKIELITFIATTSISGVANAACACTTGACGY